MGNPSVNRTATEEYRHIHVPAWFLPPHPNLSMNRVLVGRDRRARRRPNGRAGSPALPVSKIMSHLFKWIPRVVVAVGLLLAPALSAQEPSTAGRVGADTIARIRDEGLNRSQVMETLTYLTEVIGPRLTGSPNLKRANEWTRDQMVSWGLTNAHLEAWGPFGRGWSLQRFSAQVVEPQAIPLIAWPKAWSGGLDAPVVADVVYLDAKTEADLEKYKGKLKGAVVLISSPRAVPAHFEPLASRLSESNLLRLANATPSGRRAFTGRRASTNAPSAPSPTSTPPPVSGATRTNVPPQPGEARPAAANQPADPPPARPSRQIGSGERLPFAVREGAAVIVSNSSQGDGGTLFIGAATVVPPSSPGTNRPAMSGRSPWAANAPAGPAQITLAVEDYNRLVRMIERGEKLKMAVDLQVQFHDRDPMAYNTFAEIPGSDLRDEVVMLGAHLDSEHSGTGATDDGAGVAVCMEAVRILQTLKLQPRRTIRVGLWSGEEQGLLGSRAYVSKHFGYYTNATNVAALRSPKDQSEQPAVRPSSSSRPSRKLVRQRDYDRLSGYFNFDYGAGKIRGVYLQGNEAVRPLFRRWLEPFRDLGAETLSASGAGGTDHLAFDAVGLPGFQFIQDPLEYWTRTHHANADVLDRVQPDDLKQASVIMAAFVFNTATLDEKLPRKPTEEGASSGVRPR